jgi:mono/diheme cytochrome c family protein
VQHVGHHEHQHKADSVTGKVVVEKNLDKFDPDCSSCHGLGLGALYLPDAKLPTFRGNEMNASALSALEGVSPTPPDRPQWPFLA